MIMIMIIVMTMLLQDVKLFNWLVQSKIFVHPVIDMMIMMQTVMIM